MKLFKILSLVSVSFILTILFSSASQGDWELIGEKKLIYRLDHDELKLGAREGTFTRLKFKVLNAPVFIHHITVQYGNGEEDRKIIKQRIKPGNESKVVDLSGNKRIIKKIKFLYKTAPKSKKRADIIVFGRR